MPAAVNRAMGTEGGGAWPRKPKRCGAGLSAGADATNRADLHRRPQLADVHHPFAGFVTEWIWALPFWTLTWVLDCFLVEGQKALFRFGLALLKRWDASHGGAGPADGVLLAARCASDAASLVSEAYGYRIPRAKLVRRAALLRWAHRNDAASRGDQARLAVKGAPEARGAVGHTGAIGGVGEANPGQGDAAATPLFADDGAVLAKVPPVRAAALAPLSAIPVC